ncbi:hypothetical protein HJG60_008421 [Phyllostomus discolor]|uniref:Uncharacterized protein n=1 Tax=Phyllostomus discolor TaxID=89673 RepID=A0A834DM87_9CHIR|nr:hypothetical protein HJG60_008421 [Phyllostomus discolor]
MLKKSLKTLLPRVHCPADPSGSSQTGCAELLAPPPSLDKLPHGQAAPLSPTVHDQHPTLLLDTAASASLKSSSIKITSRATCDAGRNARGLGKNLGGSLPCGPSRRYLLPVPKYGSGLATAENTGRENGFQNVNRLRPFLRGVCRGQRGSESTTPVLSGSGTGRLSPRLSTAQAWLTAGFYHHCDCSLSRGPQRSAPTPTVHISLDWEG